MGSMGNGLKDFEITVINIMLRRCLPNETVWCVINEAELIDLNYSGGNYMLTFRHPALPEQRNVLSEPFITGEARGLLVGFTIFLGNQELSIDCHSFNEDAFLAHREATDRFREWEMEIDIGA
ncbi:hypothetical protein JQV27_20155 [Sulfitobacter mediterraneus]|uniref:hypothetical protein n=2 Tax=Sulfitobacter mediterraneus TaxID=83219 RepID=UPI001931F186|nr:hypothetical protein [Sulfitobacter mediterraneus]MBM1643010.1 hypothetical protein [Sulfitobacter mediterraneus]MBM1647050.1 hypothetical protein [Sulfitobacter mediterraneus]MBM1651089.1 hypothetical protein [Sulfitobacter mediterraneus]MBM1655117.1 hypothetical protein [Sulfitobacter mediterraneus]MBM1659186.1 hypothetical protein [Sulfitobacter mediterraneus]